MKKTLLAIAIVVVVLIVIVVAIPFFIDANQFKPKLESTLTMALGRQVTVGNISLALLSGGVSVDNIAIADDPAFSPQPFLQAKQLTAGVALMPLIFSKSLQVQSFTITAPQVILLRNGSGKWNFSSLGAGNSQSTSSGSSSSANVSVQKVTITNGTLTVGSIGPGAKTQSYQNVTFEASDLSYTSQFPFQLSVATPGSGKVSLDGKAGPVSPGDASLTPFDAKIGVQGLDLASTGFVAPSAGLGGLIDFNGTLTSDGKQLLSNGSVKADKLKLSAQGSAATVPVNVDYDINYDLKSQKGTLKQGNVHVGKALSNLTGAFDTSGTDATVQMKLDGSGMPVPDLEGVLPAIGVTLPQGASLQTGTLETHLAIAGPVDKLVITGPVNLANAKMAGFNLGSKLGALASFTGLGGKTGSDTEIQTFSATVRVDPAATHADNVVLVVPSIGTITGTANVAAGGELDCKMVAKLAGVGGAVGSLTSALSSFTGGGGAGSSAQNGGIPFTITGTTSKPVFVPDVAGSLKNVVKGSSTTSDSAAGAAASALGGLFGRKKSQ